MSPKPIMLMTGSSGRIGQVLIQRFKERYHIVGMDRHPCPEACIDHVIMDVSSDASVTEAFEQVKARYGTTLGPVIHLAAYYSFSKGNTQLYDQITVQGTRRVLEALQSFTVSQFHFSSTLLVYKPCPIGSWITEQSPLCPQWEYPKSKVATEEVILQCRGHIPSVIFRIAGCYDDQCHSIPISHNIQRIYEHHLDGHLFPGRLESGNPFLHLEDLADAYELAILKRDQLPEYSLFNIAEDVTIPYGKLQSMISQILEHEDFAVFRIPKWLAKAGAEVEKEIGLSDNFIEPWMIDVADDNYEIDLSYAREILGFNPKHFLGTSLPVMLELLKTDPLAWYQTNGLTVSEALQKHIRLLSK